MLGNPEQSSTGLFGYRVEKKFISRKNEVFPGKEGKPGLEEYLVYKNITVLIGCTKRLNAPPKR